MIRWKVNLRPPPQADAAEEMESGGQAGKNYGEAQLVSVSKDSGMEFFEQARLNRSKARDEALDAIKKTLKSADLSESEKGQPYPKAAKPDQQHHGGIQH